ncbi:17149_t:CDS:2, partial [Cetraspora pellucida]
SIKGVLLDEAANNMQTAILLADIDQTFEIVTMFLADYFFIIDKLIRIFQLDYISFTDIKQHITLACDALQAQFIGNNNVLPTYGQNLLKYIEENNLDTKLYEAIKIYDPKQLPISDNDLANYGNEAINIL